MFAIVPMVVLMTGCLTVTREGGNTSTPNINRASLIDTWTLVRQETRIPGLPNEVLQPGDWDWIFVSGHLTLNNDNTFVDSFGITTIEGTWSLSGARITFRYIDEERDMQIVDTWDASVSGDTFEKRQTGIVPGIGMLTSIWTYERGDVNLNLCPEGGCPSIPIDHARMVGTSWTAIDLCGGEFDCTIFKTLTFDQNQVTITTGDWWDEIENVEIVAWEMIYPNTVRIDRGLGPWYLYVTVDWMGNLFYMVEQIEESNPMMFVNYCIGI